MHLLVILSSVLSFLQITLVLNIKRIDLTIYMTGNSDNFAKSLKSESLHVTERLRLRIVQYRIKYQENRRIHASSFNRDTFWRSCRF